MTKLICKRYEISEMADVFKNHADRFVVLIKQCFGYNFSLIHVRKWLFDQKMIVLGLDQNNILRGYLAIGSDTVMTIQKKEQHAFFGHSIETYIRYDDHNKKLENEKKIYDPFNFGPFNIHSFLDTNLNSQIKAKLVYPCINGLCRDQDPEYKGLGEIMLNYVCDYLSSINIHRVYSIAESTKGREDYMNINLTAKKDMKNSQYYKSNMNLIRYYKSIGFEVSQKYYFIDVQNIHNDHIFYNVLIKKF